MKKISYALLCLALTFGMMGCNTEKQNASTRLKSDYDLTGETKNWKGVYEENTSDGKTTGIYTFTYIGTETLPIKDAVISIKYGEQIIRGDILKDKPVTLEVDYTDKKPNKDNAIEVIFSTKPNETMVLMMNENDKIYLEESSENWSAKYVEQTNGDAYNDHTDSYIDLTYSGKESVEKLDIKVEYRSGTSNKGLQEDYIRGEFQNKIQLSLDQKKKSDPIQIKITINESQTETITIE